MGKHGRCRSLFEPPFEVKKAILAATIALSVGQLKFDL